MLVDAQSRKTIFPDEHGVQIEGVVRGEEIALPGRLAAPQGDETAAFTVPFSYVDLNGHMNNTRYFDLAEDVLSPAAEGKALREIQAEYSREVRFRDTLVLCQEGADGLWRLEGRVDEKTCVRLQLRYE